MPLSGAAAVRLYDDHVDAVHAMLTRRVGPEASAGLTAETFEYAMRVWDRFDAEHGTERLFLFGAAVAVLHRHDELERTHLRTLGGPSGPTRHIADPLVGGNSNGPRVVEHDANRDLLADSSVHAAASANGINDAAQDTHDTHGTHDDPVSRTMGAVADLAPDDRDIVLLSLWEGCPQSDIAEILDLSVNAVRSSLGRIRRDVKAATSSSRSGGSSRIGRRRS